MYLNLIDHTEWKSDLEQRLGGILGWKPTHNTEKLIKESGGKVKDVLYGMWSVRKVNEKGGLLTCQILQLKLAYLAQLKFCFLWSPSFSPTNFRNPVLLTIWCIHRYNRSALEWSLLTAYILFLHLSYPLPGTASSTSSFCLCFYLLSLSPCFYLTLNYYFCHSQKQQYPNTFLYGSCNPASSLPHTTHQVLFLKCSFH